MSAGILYLFVRVQNLSRKYIPRYKMNTGNLRVINRQECNDLYGNKIYGDRVMREWRGSEIFEEPSIWSETYASGINFGEISCVRTA